MKLKAYADLIREIRRERDAIIDAKTEEEKQQHKERKTALIQKANELIKELRKAI